VFNTVWRKANCSLATAAANLIADDKFSVLIAISNPCGGGALSGDQLRLFQRISRHCNRAIRISRRLSQLNLAGLAAEHRIESLAHGVILVDDRGRVAAANAFAKEILDAREGLFLSAGRLTFFGDCDIFQRLSAVGARAPPGLGPLGGKFAVARAPPKPPLEIFVAPLAGPARILDVPWMNFGSPVASHPAVRWAGAAYRSRSRRKLSGLLGVPRSDLTADGRAAFGRAHARDSLISPDDFKETAVYNEWFNRAKVGVGILGANLGADNQFFTTLFAGNEKDDAYLSGAQALALKSALPHFANAIRVHRLLRLQDLDRDTAPERLESFGFGVMLVDGAGKVLFANTWARGLLAPGSGLTARGGYLFSTDRAAALHTLIACVGKDPVPEGPGGGIALRRSRHSPLRITVTPLRARGSVAELPWLGMHLPVAMITIDDMEAEKSVN